MKFTTIAVALLGATSAVELGAQSASKAKFFGAQAEDDTHLAQLVTTALKGEPGEITEPSKALNAVEGAKTTTTGKTVNYTYYWQYVCAFTKWVPTNQFLHAKRLYKTDGTMTLERFGFIGMNRECFWGMTGVKWVTPLKVE